MTKRSDRTPPKSDKKPIDSPNPRELKQNRLNNMDEGLKKNVTDTIENAKTIGNTDNSNTIELQKLNLHDKFTSAETK